MPEVEDLERVDTLRAARPGAFQLGRVLSLAARIELPLLRQARLLIPELDASAEADLWASELIVSRTAQGLVLDAGMASVLRRDLAQDPALLKAAWDLIAWAHKEAPWTIRTEEVINLLSVSERPEDLARAEQLLLAAARKMVESPETTAPARWLIRLFSRLPAVVGNTTTARTLGAGVGAQLDGRLTIDSAELALDAVENWFPWLLSGGRPPVNVPVWLFDGFVRIGEGDDIGGDTAPPAASGTIALPDTSPLLVDVLWHDGVEPHVERVTVGDGESRLVRITATEVELRALDGSRYRLAAGPSGSADSGIDFNAMRARHRPFLGRTPELEFLVQQVLAAPVRWVGIIGASGVGKSALLWRVFDTLTAMNNRVIAYSFDEGARPSEEAVAAALRAQAARWSSDGEAVETSIQSVLESISSELRLILIIDGIHLLSPDSLSIAMLRVRDDPRLQHVKLVLASETPESLGMWRPPATAGTASPGSRIEVEDFDVPAGAIGASAQRLIDRAVEEGFARDHAVLTNEHIFLAYAQVEWATFWQVLRDIGVNPAEIVTALDEHLQILQTVPDRRMRVPPATKLMFKLARLSAAREAREQFESWDLLSALLEESQGVPVSIFRRHGVEPELVLERLASVRGSIVVLDLDERRESNEEVCERYLDLHRATVARLNTGIAPPKVFLSSGADDEDLRREVQAALRAAGLEMASFAGSLDIQVGEDWRRKIEEEVARGMDECDLAVIVASPHAGESITQELAHLMRSGKPLLPITTDLQAALRSGALEPIRDRQFLIVNPRSPQFRSQLIAAIHALVPDWRDARSELLRRADANPQRLVSMVDWVGRQPGDAVEIANMPPVLYGAFEAAWHDISVNSLLVEMLGVLAAAREPFPNTLLSGMFEATGGEAKALARVGLAVLQPSNLPSASGGPSDEILVSLSHEAVRGEVIQRVGDDRMRRYHVMIANTTDPASFWRAETVGYASRHRLVHFVEAGDFEKAAEMATDPDFLMRVCQTVGVEALEAQLTYFVARRGGPAMRPSPSITPADVLRAIRARRAMLARHAEDFRTIVANALAAEGIQWSDVDGGFLRGAGDVLLRYLWQAEHSRATTTLAREAGVTTCAVRWDVTVAGTSDGRLLRWESSSPNVERPGEPRHAHDGAVSWLSFAAGNELLVSGGQDGALHLWSPSIVSPTPYESFRTDVARMTSALLRGDAHVTAGTEDGLLVAWDRRSPERPRHLIGHGGAVTALAAMPGDNQIISASLDGTLRAWDLSTGRTTAIMRGHAGPVIGCGVFTPAGETAPLVVSASADGLLKLWTVEGELMGTLGGHEASIQDFAMSLSPDRPARSVTAGADGTVRLWNLEAREEERVLRRCPSPIARVAVLGDSPRRVLSVATDGGCQLVHLESGRLLAEFHTRTADKYQLSVSPTGNIAAVVADGDLVHLDVRPESVSEPGAEPHVGVGNDGERVVVAVGHRITITSRDAGPVNTFVSPDPVLAIVLLDRAFAYATLHPRGLVRYWRWGGGTAEVEETGVDAAHFSTEWNGNLIVLPTHLGELVLIDRAAGTRFTVRGEPARVRACAGGSGPRIVTAHENGAIQLWDIAGDRRGSSRLVQAHSRTVLDCDVSHDGSVVLSASADGTLRLWSGDTGELRREIAAHDNAVTACWITDRINRALTCSLDGTVKLWDLETGRCLATYYADSPLVGLARASAAPVVAAVDKLGKVVVVTHEPSPPA